MLENIDNLIIQLYSGKFDGLEVAQPYFTGAGSDFMRDCQEALADPRHVGSLPAAGDWLLNNRTPKNIDSFLDPFLNSFTDPTDTDQQKEQAQKNRMEKQRLYDLVKETIFLTLFLHSIQANPQKSEIYSKWANALVAIDGSTYQELPFYHSYMQVKEIFVPAMPGEKLEKRDLLYWLLGIPLPKPSHTVEMFALGWNMQSQEGYRRRLTLDLYEESGYGLYRHPETLFLPSDALFQEAQANASIYLQNEGFQLTGMEQIKKWTYGSVRWRLHVPEETHPDNATGDSIGGAFGAGLILLLAGEESDRVGITACIDPKGFLKPVDPKSIPHKASAAIAAKLRQVIVSDQQAEVWKGEFKTEPDFQIVGFGHVLEVANYLASESRPRRMVRDAIYKKNRYINILSLPS